MRALQALAAAVTANTESGTPIIGAIVVFLVCAGIIVAGAWVLITRITRAWNNRTTRMSEATPGDTAREPGAPDAS